jgi:signal transduction histidine kinase
MGLPRGWSIKTSSFALLAGFALALTGVYVGFTVYLLHREATAAHDRLHQTAVLVAGELDTHLAAGRQRLATVAELPGLVHGLQRLEEAQGSGYIPPWTTLHYLFFKTAPFTGGVFLLDRAGKVLWTEPPGLPWLGMSLADDQWIATMYRVPGTAVSPGLAADRLGAGPHVLVTARIEDPDGAVTGLLGGVIDLTSTGFTGLLQAVSTAEGRYLAVIDQEGQIISRTDEAPLLGPLTSITRPDQEDPLAAATLEHAPWRVIAGQPRRTALAPIRQLQGVLFAIGVVMLFLAVPLASLLIRGFVGGIERLTHAAEVMARGDLSQPVATDQQHRELATLGRTFERMRTELRSSQAALTRRLEEREELMRLKEEFLANVSHELRTPLNVIFGYTDMLLEDEADSERRHALDRIRAQSGQLLNLVADLMTLSGLNTGKITLERRLFPVAELIEPLRVLMDGLCRDRPIAATVECPADLPLLHTDPLRLEQVLTNLITNAFKFTTAGTVALRVRTSQGGRQIEFEVADTGVGIPAHELPHIFDEFRQVDGSMSRPHAGLGLGLALVRRLSELLGGSVGVASHPGEGSTFTVTLPVDDPDTHALTTGRAA